MIPLNVQYKVNPRYTIEELKLAAWLSWTLDFGAGTDPDENEDRDKMKVRLKIMV